MFKLLFVRKFIVKFFKLINEVMLDLLKMKRGKGGGGVYKNILK